MRFKLFVTIWLLTACMVVAGQRPAPVLFFSDLASGPNSGNSDTTYSRTGGVYVTLYGNFLDNFTSVELNGAPCLTVVSKPSIWMWYERMVVKLGTTCTSGNFIVTTPAGTSNGIAFSVRSGKIYYVGTGPGLGNGSFSAPWGGGTCVGLTKAKQTITDGDTVYVENNYTCSTDDHEGWGSVYSLRPAWCAASRDLAQSRPRALVAYPGATVTLGNANAGGWMFARAVSGCLGGYTFAELTVRGGNADIETSQAAGHWMYNWRMVGLDGSAPNANINAQTGVFGGADIQGLYQYGNNIHNVATNDDPAQVTPLYHGWYYGRIQGADIGWNTIAYVYGCRGMQIYSENPGQSQRDFNWNIHDNTIHDTQCDGIGAYENVDPSQGYFNIYNNVIYNAGRGPQVDDSGDWRCIYVTGSSNSGTINIYSNTLYNCGSINSPGYASYGALGGGGAGSATTSISANNNIVYQSVSSTNRARHCYLHDGSPGSNRWYGTKNLWYSSFSTVTPSAGGVTSNFTRNLNVDPGFVTNGSNFHLSSAKSPANGAGSSSVTVPAYDHDGVLRPSPPAIGAYEFAPGSAGGASAVR